MPSNIDPMTVRITGPDAFPQLVPHLIGFTPEYSLVIAVFRQGHLAVTARADLPEIQPPGQVESMLDRIWTRFPDANALLAAYTPDHAAGWDVLQRCVNHLPSDAAHLTMVVDGDTWHLPDGETGTVDRFGQIAAEASYRGMQSLPSRSDLVASFTSPTDSDELAARVDTALDALPDASDRSAVIARMGELIRRNLPLTDGQPHHRGIDAQDAVQLGILSQHGQAREVALLSMTRDTAREHLDLWRSVVNQVPEYGAEPPLFLAGMAAWIAGEVAAVSIALQRLRQLGTTSGPYRPAQILDTLIDQVTPPTEWEALRADGLQNADHRVRDAVTSSPAPAAWERLPQHQFTHHKQPPDTAPPAPRIAI